jgi:pimeloyl-ACP methyl ester carboxylesterase
VIDAVGKPMLDEVARLSERVREETVSFVAESECIHGVLAVASDPKPIGVLFVHGWGGIRGGPHNLLTHLARSAAEAGYNSLRFDLRGRGQSDGTAEGTSLASMAADTIAAAKCLRECGVRKIVMIGICSGGNVAIGVLDRVTDAAGLFMLSVYPFSDGDSFARDTTRTVYYARSYWQKLWRRETWCKFFRGEIFFKQIFRVLFGHFRKDQRKAVEAAQPSPLDNLSRRRVPVKMVYGEADPDFRASYDYYAEFAKNSGVSIDFYTIPDANHNFCATAWKREITDQLLTFLTELP